MSYSLRQFTGLSAMGINQQLSFCLDSANQCIKEKVRCLSITRLAIIKLATNLPDEDEDENGRENEFEHLPSNIDIARGILPSLRHVLHQEEVNLSGDEVVTDSRVNTLNTANKVDPWGSDFFCIICFAELCNLYYRCSGCAKLLDKDYNICSRCYNDKAHHADMDMGFDQGGGVSDINKKPTFRYHTCKKQAKKCVPSRCNPQVCNQCGMCWECSCRCHRKFVEHRRFYTKQDLREAMDKCVKYAMGSETLYAKETEMTLNNIKMSIKEQVQVPSRYYPKSVLPKKGR